MSTLSERFEQVQGETLEHEGQTVRQLYRRTVSDGTRFTVELQDKPGRKVQALNLDADGGAALVINEEEMTRAVVRADTAPRRTEVLVTADGSGELTAYNAWIGSHEALHSWIGNSGMLVDDDGETVTLRCSDGDGDPSFDDLVVVLRFEQD